MPEMVCKPFAEWEVGDTVRCVDAGNSADPRLVFGATDTITSIDAEHSRISIGGVPGYVTQAQQRSMLPEKAPTFSDCPQCRKLLATIVAAKDVKYHTVIVGRDETGQIHVCASSPLEAKEPRDYVYDGSGKRPADMPARKGDREFDGGPDFGNGSWAQWEDGHWVRFGG